VLTAKTSTITVSAPVAVAPLVGTTSTVKLLAIPRPAPRAKTQQPTTVFMFQPIPADIEFALRAFMVCTSF
jgi:hypothetical protein